MKKNSSISTFILVLFLGMLGSCQKEDNNSNNNNENPVGPDTPSVIYQIPPINEYMPERLLYLFDSLNVLHRGDEPPIVEGDFMAESMSIFLLNTVPESQYSGMISGNILPEPRYFELKSQGVDTLSLTFKCPYIVTPEFYFVERSDTDSTYYRIKNNLEQFIDAPIAPPYFKSSKFTPEDFKHAYIIGNGSVFTIYFYEIRNLGNNSSVYNSLPLNAVLFSGKMNTDAEGNTIIEDFWYGMENMVYYNPNVNFYQSLNPGDIIIMQSPNTVVQGSFED